MKLTLTPLERRTLLAALESAKQNEEEFALAQTDVSGVVHITNQPILVQTRRFIKRINKLAAKVRVLKERT